VSEEIPDFTPVEAEALLVWHGFQMLLQCQPVSSYGSIPDKVLMDIARDVIGGSLGMDTAVNESVWRERDEAVTILLQAGWDKRV
jgi:hypothetical protein